MPDAGPVRAGGLARAGAALVLGLTVSSLSGGEAKARLSVAVVDEATGRGTPVRVRLTAADGSVVPPPEQAVAVMYGRDDEAEGYAAQPDGAFYVDGSFELDLEPGAYRLSLTKGTEYLAHKDEIRLGSGENVSRAYRLERWVDMPARGWYSADDHIHIRRSPRENPLILKWVAAEDVHVGALLQMGDSWFGSDFPWCGKGGGPAQIGNTRFYTKVEEPFTFERWRESLKAGHTFVSSGPIVELTVNGRLPGDELDVARGSTLSIAARANGHPEQVPLRELEIVGHGKVLARVGADDPGQSPAELTIDLEHAVEHGVWIAARSRAGDLQVAHTTPVYVTVAGGGFHNPETAGHYLDLSERYLGELKHEIDHASGDVSRQAWRYREGLQARIRETRAIIQELRERFPEPPDEEPGALEALPTLRDGWHLATEGRIPEAVAAYAKAQRLDPTLSPSAPKVVASFAMHAGASDRLNTPVSLSLDGLEVDPAQHVLELREVVGERRVPVPSQLDVGFGSRLWWILEGETPAGGQRTFELLRTPLTAAPEGDDPEPPVAVHDDGDALTVTVRGRPVLRYRHTPMPPPPGASALYARSGFIHPIWSPDGEVLTRIQPPDHLHHVGLWNPWTRTEFEGRKIDFWNLGEGQGTVRFKGLISTTSAAVYGGFRALHEHVDLSAPGPAGEKVALNEEWHVRVWNANPDGDAWLVDFVTSQSCATDSPLTVKEYRYGGFGFRATAKWDDETARLRTSEGKDKSNGHETRARWVDVQGVSAGGTAGILFMSHPGNFNHPEPLRVWPIGANDGKENVFLNFNPAQDRDWILEPGRTHTLRYRMLVYDGEVTPAASERYWKDFAHPPRVTRE